MNDQKVLTFNFYTTSRPDFFQARIINLYPYTDAK